MVDKTAIQSSVPPAPPPTAITTAPPTTPTPAPAPARRSRRPGPVKKVVSALASLRVTVVLFALSLFLVFVGTLAQMDEGIWTVVPKYFRSLYVWVPLQLFFKRSFHVSGSFPFPGGWLLGGALLVNLLAAHAVRFKPSWKRTGVIMLHSGLVLLMISEVIT